MIFVLQLVLGSHHAGDEADGENYCSEHEAKQDPKKCVHTILLND